MFVFAIVGGYILFSAFFFKYPTLLRRRKRIRFIAQNISHRGGAGEYYENTITAFRRSLEAGSNMIELDCHITKDKKVVVVHDNYLKRLTDLDKYISAEKYDDLPLIKSEIPIDFEAGKTFAISPDDKEVDRQIPLLEDVFKKFSGIPINIDIKIDNDDLIKEISNLIKKHKREELCVWGNVSSKIVQKCHNENPEVNLFFSRKQVFLLVLFFYTGLLPFIPLKETHLEIFLPSIYKTWAEAQENPRFCKCLLKIMSILLIRKSLFRHLQKRGIQTYLWVLNNESEFELAFETGATGVVTDYPTKLAQFLQDNPQYRQTLEIEN